VVDGINKHTVSDGDGELRNFSDDILGVIRDLDEMRSLMDTNDVPRSATPKLLSVYLSYYAVRHSVLSAYEAFEMARTGHLSATIGDTVADFQTAQEVLNRRFEEYISRRSKQIEVVRQPVSGDPPASWPWYVRVDHGGDTLIPQFAGGTEVFTGKNTYLLVKEKWAGSAFAQVTIKELLETYEKAHNDGKLLLGG